MILATFIILHYKNYVETMKCVDSILKLHGIEKCLILIYDNGSFDGSYEVLREHYKTQNNIKVFCNTEKDGFSRGNNKAYEIAKNYNPKFIIASNNDIVVRQKDFLKRLVCIRKAYDCHVIGPDIYAPTVAEHQSPLYETYPDIALVEQNMVDIRGRLSNIEESVSWEANRIRKNAIKKYLPAFIISAIRCITGNKKLNRQNKDIINPVLSGSFLIFTDLYIQDNEKLFYPETQFYFEELLLSEKCRKKGYILLYTPNLKVRHMHGISSIKAYDDIKDYVVFKYSNMIDSFEVYKDYYYE